MIQVPVQIHSRVGSERIKLLNDAGLFRAHFDTKASDRFLIRNLTASHTLAKLW